jgi:hypothetical protein
MDTLCGKIWDAKPFRKKFRQKLQISSQISRILSFSTWNLSILINFSSLSLHLNSCHKVQEYLTYCHHMGVSGNRFATHERGVNVRGIN